MTTAHTTESLEQIEIDLLLEGVFRHYGYDFRQYAYASIRRRIWNAVDAEGAGTIVGLANLVLHDPSAMERFLLSVSVNVTSMFRDPAFFKALRERVIPTLRTYPFIRVWTAGCSTGEEVYSVAILLKEEGLYERCRIYATDMNEAVLHRASAGIYPLSAMRDYTTNYLKSGGERSFSEYYTADHDNAIFHPSLRANTVFSLHNLGSDGSFNEFNLILCRNVMIYFKRPLQETVHRLLHGSLAMFGVLGVGSKESLQFTAHASDYEAINPALKLYRRIR